MLDNVTINQLRAFVAVCDQGSFSGAARKLRRAQSAISHWDVVEDECRQYAAQATAHQTAREAARVAAGLQQTSAAELATVAQLERDFEHQHHRESQRW